MLSSKEIMSWRTGVVHGSSLVFELTKKNGLFYTKEGILCDVEEETIFPFLKSSDVFHHRDASKYVVIPNLFDLDSKPKLKSYLESNLLKLKERKSKIFDKNPYMVFGVGPYSAKPWIIAMATFYEEPRFFLCENDPIKMFDNGVSFLSFDTKEEAEKTLELLSTTRVKEFFLSQAKKDSLRKYTIRFLNRLDLKS